jgi:hypothetical protein
MKRSALMALTVAAGIVAAGCSPISSEPPTTATPRAPTTATASAAGPAPRSMAELCDAQTWPRAVPDVVGQHLSQTTNIGALACWDNIRGVAPDGHDPINNPARPGDVGYRITALSPSPGTPVGRHDLVTVQLADADTNAPPAFRPCDWVTTDEAAGILGGPITTRSWGDDAGSVDMSCSYSLGPGGRRDTRWPAAAGRIPGGCRVATGARGCPTARHLRERYRHQGCVRVRTEHHAALHHALSPPEWRPDLPSHRLVLDAMRQAQASRPGSDRSNRRIARNPLPDSSKNDLRSHRGVPGNLVMTGHNQPKPATCSSERTPQ